MFIQETESQRKERERHDKQDDIDILERHLNHTSNKVGLLSPDLWYSSNDNMLTVANILESHYYLRSAKHAIRFFEKPWHFESDMSELIEELKEDLGIKKEEDDD